MYQVPRLLTRVVLVGFKLHPQVLTHAHVPNLRTEGIVHGLLLRNSPPLRQSLAGIQVGRVDTEPPFERGKKIKVELPLQRIKTTQAKKKTNLFLSLQGSPV